MQRFESPSVASSEATSSDHFVAKTNAIRTYELLNLRSQCVFKRSGANCDRGFLKTMLRSDYTFEKYYVALRCKDGDVTLNGPSAKIPGAKRNQSQKKQYACSHIALVSQNVLFWLSQLLDKTVCPVTIRLGCHFDRNCF